MAEIKDGFVQIVLDSIILPAVCDGGQAGRTEGGARRGNTRSDPEDISAKYVQQCPLLARRKYCWFITDPSTKDGFEKKVIYQLENCF